jgi:hypothetical protein
MRVSLFAVDRRTFFGVCALALIARLVFLVACPQYPLQDDTKYYISIARNILDGWGNSIDLDGDGIPEVTTREPGYPVFLAGAFALAGGNGLAFATAIQILVNSLMAGFAYLLGVTLSSRRVGLCAAVACALYPGLVIEATILGHEALAIPLSLIGFYFAISAFSGRYPVVLSIVAGLFFGVAISVKELFLGLPFCLALASCLSEVTRVRLKLGGIMLASSLFVIAPWIVHNMMARQLMADRVVHYLPGTEPASAAELRCRAEAAHLPEPKISCRAGAIYADLQMGGHDKSLQTTVLARTAYEFAHSDPRRPLPLLSASGGSIDGFLTKMVRFAATLFDRPTSFAAMSVGPTSIAQPGDGEANGKRSELRGVSFAQVYLVPYENRYMDTLFPDSPRLIDLLLGNAALDMTPGLAIKLAFSLGLAVIYIGILTVAVGHLGNRSYWPLYATVLYLYVVPFAHTGPLNRYAFVALPFSIVVASLSLAAQVRRATNDAAQSFV